MDSDGLKPFDLDVTFSPASHEWSGTWSHSHQTSQLVLKRPEPKPGTTPSLFVGDWRGERNKPYMPPGSLHIRQSADGIFSVWLDRTLSGFDPHTQSIHNDQRNGEYLQVNEVTASGLVLQTVAAGGDTYQFQASLSDDHQVLTGTWTGMGGGGRLSAPGTFRRVL